MADLRKDIQDIRLFMRSISCAPGITGGGTGGPAPATEATLLALLAESKIDFELKCVTDTNGDKFQMVFEKDETDGTITVSYIDADGAVATPVGAVEFCSLDALVQEIIDILNGNNNVNEYCISLSQRIGSTPGGSEVLTFPFTVANAIPAQDAYLTYNGTNYVFGSSGTTWNTVTDLYNDIVTAIGTDLVATIDAQNNLCFDGEVTFFTLGFEGGFPNSTNWEFPVSPNGLRLGEDTLDLLDLGLSKKDRLDEVTLDLTPTAAQQYVRFFIKDVPGPTPPLTITSAYSITSFDTLQDFVDDMNAAQTNFVFAWDGVSTYVSVNDGDLPATDLGQIVLPNVEFEINFGAPTVTTTITELSNLDCILKETKDSSTVLEEIKVKACDIKDALLSQQLIINLEEEFTSGTPPFVFSDILAFPYNLDSVPAPQDATITIDGNTYTIVSSPYLINTLDDLTNLINATLTGNGEVEQVTNDGTNLILQSGSLITNLNLGIKAPLTVPFSYTPVLGAEQNIIKNIYDEIVSSNNEKIDYRMFRLTSGSDTLFNISDVLASSQIVAGFSYLVLGNGALVDGQPVPNTFGDDVERLINNDVSFTAPTSAANGFQEIIIRLNIIT